jgi:hypothetical protein
MVSDRWPTPVIEEGIPVYVEVEADGFGGGGAGGGYEFSSIAELDAVIAQWTAERDQIDTRSVKIYEAFQLVRAPAEDMMSVGQAEAFMNSLLKLQEHNQALFDYADGYLHKLVAARASYLANEDAAALRMTNQREA